MVVRSTPNLRSLAITLIAGLALLVTACTERSPPDHGTDSGVPTRVISFDTTEGTFMTVDVSPDGETLVFDLLGDLYSLPFAGGKAVPLTTGSAWDQAPRFSPDGQQVYFVSDRQGRKNIWRLTIGDGLIEQITASESDVLGSPNWSQEDHRLLVGLGDAHTYNTEIVLQFINVDSGSMTPLEQRDGHWIDMDTFKSQRQRILTYSGVQSADGQVHFSELNYDLKTGRSTVRLFAFDTATQTRTAITPVDASYSEYKPQLSNDGRLLAYFRQHNDRRSEIRIRNRDTGQDEAVLSLSDVDDASYTIDDDSRPNYAFTPDDRFMVFWHGGKLHRLAIADGTSELIPFEVKVEREVNTRVEPTPQHISDRGEAQIIRWPSVSRDGQTMAFAAIGYVWLMDMNTGAIRRLTDSGDFEYMPAMSPDGASVAFVSFAQSGEEYGPGRLVVARVEDGTQRDLLAAPDQTYLIPKWSQDGSMIAAIRETKSNDGLEATFGWTPVENAVFHAVTTGPASNELISGQIFARFAGFDETGRHLLFSHALSKQETVLVSAALDGSTRRTVAIGTEEVGGITPAPDLSRLALTRDDGTVWLVPFPADETSVEVSTLAPDARRISEIGGYYLDWSRHDRITYGFGQNVYRYDLGGNHPVDGGPDSLPVKLSFVKPKAAQAIAFTGARLITLADAASVIESGTLVVDGRRISAIGPMSEVTIPANAVVIDAAGKTIIPGLIDTHYHRIGGGDGVLGVSAFKLPNSKFSDRSAIGYGVTMAWEPAGPASDGSPATVDLQAAGRILGPRWSHTAMGGVGAPYELLNSYAAAQAAVERYRRLGVAVLKEYLAPTRQQRQWLSAAARESGMGIVSHLHNFDGIMTRIVDGYTGGDHPYMPVPFFRDVQELMRQTGYIWTPNVIITTATVATEQRNKNYFCHAVLTQPDRVRPKAWEDRPLCPADQTGASEPAVPYDTHRFSRVASQVARAASAGVHIGVSAHNMPGSNLHQEMWYLRKGGMPIEAVLRATTIGNARKLGLQEELGSLEVGKLADFLVLDANPLDDILNTLSLRYTVQGGVIYDSDTAEPLEP